MMSFISFFFWKEFQKRLGGYNGYYGSATHFTSINDLFYICCICAKKIENILFIHFMIEIKFVINGIWGNISRWIIM